MYKKYIDALITAISIDPLIEAKEYFGELENPQDGKFLKGSLPIVYIDFIADDTSKPRVVEIDLALYIVHISYSKSEEIRSSVKNEIHNFLRTIYKSIAFQSIEGSEPIILKKLIKIYDANAAGGYVSIYKKDISITIPNPLMTGGI